MKRVSLKDVAAQAGVSAATASYALRGLARVPERTRLRVEAAADALGYERIPGVSAAMAYVRSGDDSPFRHVFAVIGPEPLRPEMRGSEGWLRDLYRGIERHAKQRHCGIDYFPLGGKTAVPLSSLNRILQARGLRGVIILPLPPPMGELPLRWEVLAPVAIGFSLLRPELHRIASNTLPMINESVRLLRDAGARRIGLCLSREMNLKNYNILEASFLLAQDHWSKAERVPVHITGESEEGVVEWFRKRKPDALIGNHSALTELQSINAVRALNPERCVWLDLWPEQKDLTGFTADFDGLARSAVETTLNLVEHGIYGLLDRAPITLVPPFFHIGLSQARVGALALARGVQ